MFLGLLKSEEKQVPVCWLCFYSNHDRVYNLKPNLITKDGCECPCHKLEKES